ncbi:hypothetical protein QQX98_000601 [Neonectria punicea]|uniref:Uncharacterized protein n=1 Tax=Neonectria punicea TaxID=979145 RepID=A0ABR1HSX9_9HYPO
MSHADTQTTPDTGLDVPSVEPSWLKYLSKCIKDDEEQGEDTTHFQIVRDLLLAPDDDDSAVSKAVDRFRDDYVAGFAEEDFGGRMAPEYDAGLVLNSLAVTVFEVVNFVSFTDIKHDKLANLLIGIKATAAKDFSTDDPQFVYYAWGFEAAADDSWKHNHANGWLQDINPRTAKQASDGWLSRSALIAKLFKGGLLDSDGPPWIWHDFKTAFEAETHGEVATNVGRQAQVLAPANCILIAGDAVAKEAKSPSRKWQTEVTPAKWKLWASKLEEVANAVGEDATWGLKAKAQEAHDKMVKLYPEAFEEGV